jgi:hypothetical protein
LLLLPFFSAIHTWGGNRYATNYYCCRYWNFYFGGKLLANLGMEHRMVFTQSISTYELTGNLHFEGVMLFFFLFGNVPLTTK